MAKDNNSKFGRFSPFIIGSLTFFLPCGFTVIAQGLALASGSIFSGALIMLFFSLGTIFPLTFISISGLSLSGKSQYNLLFSYTLGLILLFFGLFNLSNQANIVGIKLPNISLAATNQTNQNINLPQIDGKQILETYADSNGYSPRSVSVAAGKPILWKITNNGVSGCTGGIISRDLFGGTVQLINKVTEINLPALKPGTYRYTCWMGMVGGEIVAN